MARVEIDGDQLDPVGRRQKKINTWITPTLRAIGGGAFFGLVGSFLAFGTLEIINHNMVVEKMNAFFGPGAYSSNTGLEVFGLAAVASASVFGLQSIVRTSVVEIGKRRKS